MIANTLHDYPPESFTPDLRNPMFHENVSSRKQSAGEYRDFLKRASFQFPHVVYVAGNHEFYHGDFFGNLTDLRNECSRFPNVHFLENETKEIDGVHFIGATLWTDCNKQDPRTLHALGNIMTDFSVIRNDQKGYTKLKPADTAIRHIHTIKYLKKEIQGLREQKLANLKVVFVGHHAPSHLSIMEEYVGDVLMNGGFYSDLSEVILDHPEIVLWTHGHMHHKFDYMIGDTRVVCNPRGYIGYEPQANDFEIQYLDI